MPEPLLNLHDVHIQHAGATTKACEAVSFAMDAGERIALVGRSGAGKTTLLRAVNASIPVCAGQITFAGGPANPIARSHLRDLRRRIAMVPQKHDLIEGLRVSHNVMAGALGRWSDAHALRFLVWPTARELAEAENALRRVGLADKLRSRAGALSGGQQQRVAIARALVQRPLLLLADEPVASLDPATARQVLELLCWLAETEKMALICTLHQPDLAQHYFPRRLTMEGGRLVDDTHAAGDRSPAARSRAAVSEPTTCRLAGARD